MPRQCNYMAVAAFVLFAAPASGQGFSTAPLSAPSAMPADSLAPTPLQFLDWLRRQDPATFTSRAQLIREHLYALIAQSVKQRFAATQATEPLKGDSTLAQLFARADQFGVPGASEVANAIGASSTPAATPPVTDGFQLTFSPSLASFALATENGKWMVSFPYFFMVGSTTRQRMANGTENDVATLSTLTGANSEPRGGASQGTILILSAQTPDLPSYVAFWLQQLQVAQTDTVANPVPQATRSYRRFDRASGLWKEVVSLKIPSGSLIVAYIGLDGTYQVNRPHFLDLLKSLRVRR
jgi:hypothetical protein